MSKIAILKEKIFYVIRFLTKGIWRIDLTTRTKKTFLIKTGRTIILALRGLIEDKVSLRASALTFYSLLSIVPVMAMAFGIAKGFGFDDKLKTLLQENIQGQKEVVEWVVTFATNMLENTKGGWVFGVGLLFLLWSILKVLGNIENAFNSIWQVKKSRVFFRKFSDYFSILLVAPILLLMSSSAQVAIIEMVNKMTQEVTFLNYIGPLLTFGLKIIPYILIWLLFTFIYMAMPNTKVKFTSALVAGIIAGTIFQGLQWGYFHFQIGVSKYNAIYGSFAALPLFLVWLNTSWLIVLFGAEISFSVQNQQKYEFETVIKELSPRSKHIISIFITNFVIKNFQESKLPLSAQQISAQLKIPIKLVRFLLYDLVECRILAETPSTEPMEPAFLPARNTNEITIQFVVSTLNNRGRDFKSFKTDKAYNNIEEILNDFETSFINSPKNMLLGEI